MIFTWQLEPEWQWPKNPTTAHHQIQQAFVSSWPRFCHQPRKKIIICSLNNLAAADGSYV